MQRHLFLKSFGTYAGVAVPYQLRIEMNKQALQRYGSKDFADSPHTLDELFSRCSEDGFVKKISPSSWKITPNGEKALMFMEQTMLPEPMCA
jgi:hypothetical protein